MALITRMALTCRWRTDAIRAAGLVNRLAALEYPDDTRLRARIKSYELAFRMQTSVPELLSFRGEGESTRRLYGLDQDVTRDFGQQLLAARRLSERYHRSSDGHPSGRGPFVHRQSRAC